MSTHYADEQQGARSYGDRENRPSWGGGPDHSSRRRRSKPFFLTSEFLTMLAAIAAIAIAAAIADDFDARRAWTLISVVAAAYIISRGLSKIGRGDGNVDD